jgi:hypothetical protein
MIISFILYLILYNIPTATKKMLANVATGAHLTSIDRKNNVLYFDSIEGIKKMNLLTNVVENVGKTIYLSTAPNYMNNKIIYQRMQKDTMTNGKRCKYNYRNHIAIMNPDGTNERQVLIPE